MKISIIGTGYVGLVSGTCFAEVGVPTVCVDVDEIKINNIKNGILPIWEPNLEELVEKNIKNGRLQFTTNLSESIQNADACFIAVGTPPGEDGSADLKYVLDVAREIGQTMTNYIVVVTKSTVPVGTSEKVRQTIQAELNKRKSDLSFDVASNPEFLKEGAAVDDCLKPDRIVIGTDNDIAKRVLEKIYEPFTAQGYPLICMDIYSAELTKYTANAMLATKISFINDIALLAEKLGADINAIRLGIGSDKRIGMHFINAGIGYGGSCFPKDVKALIKTAEEYNHPLRILQAVEEVNKNQKTILFHKALNYFNHNLQDKIFAIWGLSFKPNTNDVREASSFIVIELLLNAGAKVVAYDPVAIPEAKEILADKIKFVSDKYDALENADAIFLITEWKEFFELNFNELNKMKTKVIFDGRNIYDKKQMLENNIDYISIGR